MVKLDVNRQRRDHVELFLQLKKQTAHIWARVPSQECVEISLATHLFPLLEESFKSSRLRICRCDDVAAIPRGEHIALHQTLPA